MSRGPRRIRRTFYPAFYRVTFHTVAGLTWGRRQHSRRCARRIQKANATKWETPVIQACWYVDNEDGSRAYTLDMEVVR